MRYFYKGNTYQILHESKMKIGQVWLDCVVYQSENDKKVWVREKIDFSEKFVPVLNINAVCVLIRDKDGLFLGVSRKTNHNDFGLPGGKVEPEDISDVDAIRREVREETGLELTNIERKFTLPCVDKNGMIPCTLFTADYFGEINHNEPHVVKWVRPETILLGSFSEYNKEVFDRLNIEY